MLSYEKLWILLRKNKMTKNDLATAAKVSSYTMTKLNKSEPVSLEVMENFCKIFHCNVGDLVDYIED